LDEQSFMTEKFELFAISHRVMDSINNSLHDRDARGRELEILGIPELHIIERELQAAYDAGLADGIRKATL